MDVEPVDQQPPRGPLDPVHQVLVAVVGEDLLVAPLPERVGSGRGERQAQLVARPGKAEVAGSGFKGAKPCERGQGALHIFSISLANAFIPFSIVCASGLRALAWPSQ